MRRKTDILININGEHTPRRMSALSREALRKRQTALSETLASEPAVRRLLNEAY
jgi:hypothetical protein